MELFEEIRREYEHGVGTIKGVARKLGVHRRMVREALASAVPAERKAPVRERPKLAAAIPFIDAVLEADRKAPRKQRHTAHRVWTRLRQEMPGVDVAESTVREYVRERKAAMGLLAKEVFVPQSYAWGSEGQVDWYEAWAELDGEPLQAKVFCMRSMASGAAYHRAYPHASQQAFLEAHELAFEYFGGVFRVLRYDNLKSAVKKILRGHQREETERFIGFRSHWGFEADFCTPGEGHEKGGVEGEGGQFRRNQLVPVPRVRDWDELNLVLVARGREQESRVLEGRTQSIGAAMLMEREYLLPLAEEGFDLAAVHFPEVNASSCVRVLTNFYSVPAAVGSEVQAKVYASHVELWQKGRRLARHERCFGRHQKVLELDHYLDVLVKKPGAMAGATALEQCRAKGLWPASYDRFWKALKDKAGTQAGTRSMVEVLLLQREHGFGAVRAAVEEALRLECANLASVRYLLKWARQQRRPEAETIDVGGLRRYDRPQPAVAAYDELRPNWTAPEVLQ